MLEIPETTTIAYQAETILIGKTISRVVEASSPHSFTWYNGTAQEYSNILLGKQIKWL